MRKLVSFLAVVLVLGLIPMVGAGECPCQCLDAFQKISIRMDLSKNLSDLVSDGHYDHVSADFAKISFQTRKGIKDVEVYLVTYDPEMQMRTAAILRDIDRRGLRPATPQEFLWVGIHDPTLFRVATLLDEGWMVDIRQMNDGRRLSYGIGPSGFGFLSPEYFHYHFATVRK